MLPLTAHTVTNADNFKALRKALGDAFNAIGKKGAAQSVLRTGLAVIFNTAEGYMTVSLFVFEQEQTGVLSEPLGPLTSTTSVSDLDSTPLGTATGSLPILDMVHPPTRFRTEVRRPPSSHGRSCRPARRWTWTKCRCRGRSAPWECDARQHKPGVRACLHASTR